jgi:hypothetical protein
MSNSNNIKEKFDELYIAWEREIQDPRIQFSSRPQDYIENEPYRQIVQLGKEALPLVLEKISAGVFFMNQAALEIAGSDLEQIGAEEQNLPAAERLMFAREEMPQFLSEQQKSELILKYLEKGEN